MANVLAKIFPTALRDRLQAQAWVIAVLVILLCVGVRVRLGDMPLERDEGEYAYIGQLILQGDAPYRDAYNMKLPGTYLAYAVSMAIFGQTPAGIHLGLALVNAATIWLMFLLGKRILDAVSGVVAAVAGGPAGGALALRSGAADPARKPRRARLRARRALALVRRPDGREHAPLALA